MVLGMADRIKRKCAYRTLFGALLLAATAALAVPEAMALRRQATGAFPAQFVEADLFSRAIAEVSKKTITPARISGITVPHHLLAAKLIAEAFATVDRSRIEKVVVLFPDHFRRSKMPFATTERSFETVFGQIKTSRPDVRLLLRSHRLVERSDLFATDHGIGALLPFIRHYLPAAEIVPIAVALRSQKSDWDQMASVLQSVVTPATLVVQSTDFSHYLPQEQATQRDQEVLNILASNALDAVERLHQPDHTDSRGSQYLQMRIQRDFFKTRPIAIFNSSSHAYAKGQAGQTTTYIVQLYRLDRPEKVGADIAGSRVYCFAGDTFFGRGMLRALAGQLDQERMLHTARSLLNGCKLIVNLTGVIVPEIPLKLENLMLAMPAALTLRLLKALNVVAVSLANNHAMDLGPAAFEDMRGVLNDQGIVTLTQGSVVDLGHVRLIALTDLDNNNFRTEGVVKPTDIARLAASDAKPPLFAMINWGTDRAASPGPRQIALRSSLRQAAISLVIGVHPHSASADLDLLEGGGGLSVFSLGNFMFDQNSTVASGSILEVRVFEQGTYFARLVRHPNFFESASQGR
jgi:AmmeMemoRadiSam system protein B